MTKVYDGENAILGRVCAVAAKQALLGEEIIIYNAERMVITGNKKATLAKYKQRMEFRDHAKPSKNPKLSRRPDLFVKRILRNMLPWKTARGREVFKKIRVYMGKPEREAEKICILDKDIRFTYIGDLCKELGWYE